MALDGEELLAGYRDWRVARGFLGPDTLAGVTADDAPAAQYAGMDRSSLQALADSGDMGAMQAYAAGSLPADPFTALEYYGRASELGSAAAMLEIADILAGLAGLEEGSLTDPVAARRLQALRRAEPDRDGRLDAAAWNLAAIRQYGPAVAGSSSLGFLAGFARDADPAQVAYACARSLAILADNSAATAGRYGGGLPPVFVTEQDLYERLPCRETPAPVMPPGALDGCHSTAALGAGNRPVDLWICPAT
jgi:TPR repeat protein